MAGRSLRRGNRLAALFCLVCWAVMPGFLGACWQGPAEFEVLDVAGRGTERRGVLLSLPVQALDVGEGARFTARGDDSNWLVRTDEGYEAFRARDTVLGHALEYDPRARRFRPSCGRHVDEMSYDWRGLPLSYRPPRPLEAYLVVVRHGAVRVVDVIDRRYDGPPWATKPRHE